MESFSQLLNEHVQRSGISDAELARAIGVSRQTIFRWREGTTGRPRHREDVLAIARKLRLTPEERDTLLLTAGFRPEEERRSEERGARERESGEEAGTLNGEVGQAEARPPSPHPPISPSPHLPISPSSYRPLWWLLLAAVFLLIGGGIWWAYGGQIDRSAKNTPTVGVVSVTVTPTNPPPLSATAGETVVLVTHFANYASSQIGYNVAGRLAEALQREIDDIRLQNMRITIWPEVVGESRQALQAGQAVSATLVIYGEYDVGRVVVRFVHPADQQIFTGPALQRYVVDPQELSTTINSDLPQQVRSLALLALGQIYINQGEMDQARSLLVQARDKLQDDTQVDEQTWAVVNFYLGIAYHHSEPPHLDGAILAYTEAVEAWPQMISSRLNRIAAYEARNQPGDLELALADADAVVAAAPEWGAAYINRSSILINLGGGENLTLALTDLERAIALEPTFPEAYVNRAYAYLRQSRPMAEIALDLEKAMALRPDYGSALNLFCWGHALDEEPELALPYCQQAVAAEPDELEFRDSRGLAYALLGDYPAAIADFQAYAAWLEEQSGDIWQSDLARRRTWIEALEVGENPFTPELLAELRKSEFGQ